MAAERAGVAGGWEWICLDVTTPGAKIGVAPVVYRMVNEGLVGPDSIILTQKLADGSKKAIVARFDDLKFKGTGDAPK